MKKMLPMLLFAALCLVFVACGHEKEEPVVPTQNLESVYQSETDVHFTFDIDLNKDSSSIYLYNVVFTIGERVSPAMNIRIDAPVTVDNTGKVYTYSGTDIVPYLMRGTTAVPAPSFLVTNLVCAVNTSDKTYNMTFNCHGGSFAHSGNLR